jgi:hypothetical protein
MKKVTHASILTAIEECSNVQINNGEENAYQFLKRELFFQDV